MKATVLLGLTCLVAFAMFETSHAAFARCECGSRCGTFNCNPDTTNGCDCANCRCRQGSIGFRRCCKDSCGFWGSSTKCFTCKPYQYCTCDGCRSR